MWRISTSSRSVIRISEISNLWRAQAVRHKQDMKGDCAHWTVNLMRRSFSTGATRWSNRFPTSSKSSTTSSLINCGRWTTNKDADNCHSEHWSYIWSNWNIHEANRSSPVLQTIPNRIEGISIGHYEPSRIWATCCLYKVEPKRDFKGIQN